MPKPEQALLGALGICRKAGKLLYGYDRVEEAVLRGKISMVLLASDASKRTADHMHTLCEGLIPCKNIPLTSVELNVLTPKPAAVFGVADDNLARLCAKHLA
ncbi:MAG: ribosomal L7Ae/L30e/S12e/Gadd45 family protein [Gemmiger sp.]|nr:ribosomal L7Ae/L30e/S12e/Gadd45 family protein [Gemmiger sp.]